MDLRARGVRRNHSLLPRAFVDELSAEFTFLISLTLLSIIMFAFIVYEASDTKILFGVCILAIFDYLGLRSKRRMDGTIVLEE